MAKIVASRPCLFRRTLEAIERCSLDRAQQGLTVARLRRQRTRGDEQASSLTVRCSTL
jgi:hypothetical protein